MTETLLTWSGDDISVDRRLGDAITRLGAVERALFSGSGGSLERTLLAVRAPLTVLVAELVAQRGTDSPLALQAQSALCATLMRLGETEPGQSLAIMVADGARRAVGVGGGAFQLATRSLAFDMAVVGRAEIAEGVAEGLVAAAPYDAPLALAAARMVLGDADGADAALALARPPDAAAVAELARLSVDAALVAGRWDLARRRLHEAYVVYDDPIGNGAELSKGYYHMMRGELARRRGDADTAARAYLKAMPHFALLGPTHEAVLTLALRTAEAHQTDIYWDDAAEFGQEYFAANDPRQGLIWLVGAKIARLTLRAKEAETRLRRADAAWAGWLAPTHPFARERAALDGI